MSAPEQFKREKPLILSPTAARRMHLLLRGKGLETGSEHEQGLLQHVLDRQSVLQEACRRNDDSKYDQNEGVECNASVLDKDAGASAKKILLGESEGNQDGPICRHRLHDCVASQGILDRLMVQSGDLVEVCNIERPKCIPRLARIWLGEFSQIKECGIEAKISPFLAYNIGIPYHVLPFVHSGTSHTCSEKSFRISFVRYDGRHYNEISKDGEIEHVDIANPSTDYVPMPVASEVVLSVIREPAIDGDLQPQGEEDDSLKDTDEMESAANSGMEPDADEASECIHAYFGQDVQILSQGDIIAIQVPVSNRARPGGSISALNSIIEDVQGSTQIGSSDAWDTSSSSVLYFKVTVMTPHQPAIQAVNIKHTAVKLGGIISSGIPVGARGYLCGSGDVSKFLGWAWDACWSPDAAHLVHVGHLLLRWRNIAEIIAPVIHPSSRRIPMKCSILLHGTAGSGKRTAAAAAAAALGCHLISISCQDIKVEGIPDEKVIEGLQAVVTIASGYRPVLLLLRDLHLLAPLNHPNAVSQAAKIGSALSKCIIQGFQENDKKETDKIDYCPFPSPLIVIGCAPSVDDVGAGIRRCFTHEVACEAPDTAERELLLRSFLRSAGKSLSDESWSNLVRHTAGLFPLDLKSMAAEACAAAALEACIDMKGELGKSTSVAEESGANTIKVCSIEERHIESSITCVRERTATDIGAPRIPNVQWDDVGGLEDVKLAILDTVELPLKHPALFAGGLRRRSGVLLYGPPGTGKTLLAKAVATECAVNFLSVKGPELINMYVGESERLVREVFIRARRARPCVIFFDELDSLAPARGRGSDSGGVMDRIVSQLLAEIDCAQGGSGTDDIFIIGATNRPDLLDPALLRPGRLDKLLYVGIAAETSDRLKVLFALTRKFCLANDVDLMAVAAACPARLTGADMYGLCSSAWMIALKRQIASNPSKNDSSIVVNHQDFVDALSSIQPSLTINDIQQYEQVQRSYVHR
eukprot:jgi/Picsp_1/1290/NSC_04771-R1_peroxin 6